MWLSEKLAPESGPDNPDLSLPDSKPSKYVTPAIRRVPFGAGGTALLCMLIVHVFQALPHFESVDVEDEAEGLKESILLSMIEGGLLLGQKAARKKSSGGASKAEIVGEADLPMNGAGFDVSDEACDLILSVVFVAIQRSCVS